MELSKRILAQENSPVENYYVYANRAKKHGTKVYHLNIGQPDITTPPAFMKAVRSFDADVLAYAPSEGRTDLIDAVRRYYKRFGVEAARDEIIVTHGGSEALDMAFATILNEGDEVIMAEPFYTNYNIFAGMHGGTIVPIPTRPEDGYHYASREKIEKAITPKTKAFCICNPGNPTGTVLTEKEMKMICDLAVKHDFFIIADEVYREFAYDEQQAISFGKFTEAKNNIIITDSASKRFSACGARIGTLFTKNQDVIDNVVKLAQARLCCPTLDQLGAVTLYDLPRDFFDDIKEEYKARRDAACDALHRIEGVVCEKPGGSFYITCKLPIKNAHNFLVWMLTEFSDNGETAMFAPVEGFYGTPGKGKSEIRIAYVLNTKDLLRGIELIKLGLERYMEK